MKKHRAKQKITKKKNPMKLTIITMILSNLNKLRLKKKSKKRLNRMFNNQKKNHKIKIKNITIKRLQNSFQTMKNRYRSSDTHPFAEQKNKKRKINQNKKA